MTEKNRRLVLRRGPAPLGQIHLFDEESGLPLAGQSKVTLIQEPCRVTRIVVEFVAAPADEHSVRVDISDG